jgi:hypothetical protein
LGEIAEVRVALNDLKQGQRHHPFIGLGLIPDCLGCTSTVDLSHTARAAQILPRGWTFTSDSGDFLVAATPPAVPEPATFG